MTTFKPLVRDGLCLAFQCKQRHDAREAHPLAEPLYTRESRESGGVLGQLTDE